MNYLFYFSFGPVQGFISQSRKTQDLYAGSRLLSILCQIVQLELMKYTNTFIMPPQLDSEAQASLPNYVLVILETAKPKDLAEDIDKTLRQAFSQLADECFKYATKETKTKSKPIGFNSQIENHLETYWCFQPLENEQAYAKAYAALQKQLAAIKNTRCFAQLNGDSGEQGRKCNLDGERNALFYRKNSSSKKAQPPHIEASALDLESTKKLLPNEGLSAVSLMKRYCQPYADSTNHSIACKPENNQRQSFPSTAEIALMPYLAEIRATLEGNAFSQFLQERTFGEDDAQLYFEENLNESYFKRQGLSYAEKAIPELKEKLQAIPKTTVKKTPYYAVLVFDGDDMGKWLSGEYLADKAKLREFHKRLSTLLGNFAQTSKNLLQDPRGQAVYAGGDDFLGFVALRDVLSFAKELRQAFDEQVNKPIYTEFQLKAKLTFSAGIALAHYKTPLHVVLDTAHQMLEHAKQADNKNAFAIKTIKHSGESHQTRYPWFDSSDNSSLIADLQKIIEELQAHFSDTFIRVLNREILALLNRHYRKIRIYLSINFIYT